MPNETDIEVCSSCGDLFSAAQINEETGWCHECSGTVAPTVSWHIRWLERNADKIEQAMVEHSLSATRAKQFVAQANRKICLCCNKPIKGFNKNSLFCSTTAECRRAQNTYHRTKSIQQALESALVLNLENNILARITYPQTT